MEAITIEVDERAAQAFRKSTPAERRKMEQLLSLRLSEYLEYPASLEEAMREMSREAVESGLTPHILQDILRDEA